MEELQVPTQRVTVQVFTDRGECLSGGLFVTETPYHANRLEDLKLALNDQRSFLPFAPDPGGTICTIVNKAHVMRVRVEGPPTDLLAGAPMAEHADENSCRLSLSDGTAVTGEVAVDTPWSLSRLVDKLNQAEAFVLFVTPDGVEFIQIRHIICVN